MARVSQGASKFRARGRWIAGGVALAVVVGLGALATAVRSEDLQTRAESNPVTTVDAPATFAASPTVPATTPTESTVATGPSQVAAAPGDASTALALLDTIPVELEHGRGYDRDLFEHWIDADGDGCDTRREVLIRDSITPVTVLDECWINGGTWVSPYDGATHTNPGDLDIDHVVALKEAWDSGAWAWDESRRRDFANDLTDPRTLHPVTASVNRGKSDADPSNWIPSDPGYLCTYLSDWVHIKATWGLSMDESEAGRIRNLLIDRCGA